jgi:hypothetical protein
MNQRHANRTRTRAWTIVLALICVFAFSAPALAAPPAPKSASGTVTVRGTIVASVVIPTVGTGKLVLIDKLRITPNKKEWYYVYTFVDANNQPVKMKIQSNRAWTGTLTAVQTSGDKKKMDLGGGLLHLSTTRPTSFAQADAALAVKTTVVNLASIPGMPPFVPGTASFYQYFLLHVSEGSGSTTFSVNLTYQVGQTSPGKSTSTTIPLVFDVTTCCS